MARPAKWGTTCSGQPRPNRSPQPKIIEVFLRMLLRLLVSRRFAPLFWCQFFSAFNDNLVRTMLAMMILFRVGEEAAGPLVTLAVGVFILPSLVLSAVGGELADSHDKAAVARWLKLAELGVQALVAAGFWFGSIATL